MDVLLSGLCGGGDWVRGKGAAVQTANAAATLYAEARMRAVGVLLRSSGVVLPGVLPVALDRTITPGAAFASAKALAYARSIASVCLSRSADTSPEALRDALECAVKTRDDFEAAWHAAGRPRTNWPVYWAWPHSALGERPTGPFDVRCVSPSWDTILLHAHAAVASMHTHEPTVASGHWRAVLREQVRWPSPEHAGRSLPGWRTRLAEPELHPNTVLAMIHVCRAAELLDALNDDLDDPTNDMRVLGYASNLERAGGPWAETRIRALSHLGAIWPAVCHLAAAQHHATLSRRALREGHTAEHTAGMRPAIHGEIAWMLARGQARIALTAGLVCDRTLGRHELGAALLHYTQARTTPSDVSGPVFTLMQRHTGDGGPLAMPPLEQITQIAVRASASHTAVRQALGHAKSRDDGPPAADDAGLLHRLAQLAEKRAHAPAPDAVVMLCSLRAI